MCGLSPNFYIHVSVSDLYIPRIGSHISSSRKGRPIAGIYNSLTDSWMWKLGLPRYSFSGNICFKFSAFFLCSAGNAQRRKNPPKGLYRSIDLCFSKRYIKKHLAEIYLYTVYIAILVWMSQTLTGQWLSSVLHSQLTDGRLTRDPLWPHAANNQLNVEPVFVNLLRSPGIDSQPDGNDSSESITGILNRLKIRALVQTITQRNKREKHRKSRLRAHLKRAVSISFYNTL